MGVCWTSEQQQVIDTRNCNILVAAAAGSGKTAVLVERIITRLTKDEHPLNVDELLIVTFTEAAAAEMKERILIAIEKALEVKPGDTHLQKQATLIHTAMITTIHSFCLSMIRDHFHTIDLDPNFRIGEEGELKLIKQEILNQLLEEEYGERRAEFLNFVECVAPGRSDVKIEELILNVFEFSRSNPQPQLWLDSCVEKYNIQTREELENAQTIQALISMIKCSVSELKLRIAKSLALCEEPDGPNQYIENLKIDWEMMQSMSAYIDMTKTEGLGELEGIGRWLRSIKWEALSRARGTDVDPDKKLAVQDMRKKMKKIIDNYQNQYFYLSVEMQIEELKQNKMLIQELVHLVQRFSVLYEKEKQNRGMIDFSDMEQYALRILTRVSEGKVTPSKVAEEYQQKFAEVMIDEYQDSNLVQESILTSVSKMSQGEYNVFMVGDVKQSIYRFRLSRPELFMEKFRTYHTKEECRIDLNKNFRSRDEVLDTTNYVFYRIMKEHLGGVQYDEASALYCGANYPECKLEDGPADNRTELLLLDEEEVKQTDELEENSRQLEARLVARRIKELVGSHMVYDKHMEGYRPAKYGDIVLLSRSLSGWSDVFAKGLGEEGIPTSVENREGYFSTFEIALLLDYLRVLDNPQQDIPLTAVLRSVFGNITDNELAMIKGQLKKCTFFEAVYVYAGINEVESEEEPEFIDEELQRKLRTCLDKIEYFRKKIAYMGIRELLWDILKETNYREYIYAMPGGEKRLANVEMLLEKATAFEGTSYKGIFNFIRYIEQLEKYKVEYGEANMVDELEDAVRIMSIHKSKGLEFPIVFVIGMGKLFNKRDQLDLIVMHLDAGLGIDTISAQNRTKRKSLTKRLIQRQLEEESLGEELRVLYVAMTRAKEKLIMTGKVRNLEKKLAELDVKVKSEHQASDMGYLDLLEGRSYLDWVLPNVYKQLGAKIVIKKVGLDILVQKELEEEIEGDITRMMLRELGGKESYHEAFKEKLHEQFTFQYPYKEEQDFKLKMSVTEIKKRAQMMEEQEEGITFEEMAKSKEESEPVLLEPNFVKKYKEDLEIPTMEQGAFRGTAYHRLMELWDFRLEYSGELLQDKLQQYKSQKKMSPEMIDCIQPKVMETFLHSPIALRMKEAAYKGQFFKEQPFVMGVNAEQIYGVKSQEIVLVQGIIDVYFEEEDGLIVLDYKTDMVRSLGELEKRYHAQLDYYAQALEQLTGKKVKEKIIYSLTLQDSILIK